MYNFKHWLPKWKGKHWLQPGEMEKMLNCISENQEKVWDAKMYVTYYIKLRIRYITLDLGIW